MSLFCFQNMSKCVVLIFAILLDSSGILTGAITVYIHESIFKKAQNDGGHQYHLTFYRASKLLGYKSINHIAQLNVRLPFETIVSKMCTNYHLNLKVTRIKIHRDKRFCCRFFSVIKCRFQIVFRKFSNFLTEY